jgi:hypothetical protein
VFPPAHADQRFEFELPDCLPTKTTEARTIQLLTLAMLDSVNLITRPELPDGQKFYRLDPRVLKVQSTSAYVDDEDLQLPGKPGKFYSLYAELCKDEVTRKNLLLALRELASAPGFRDTLNSSIERRLAEFRGRLSTRDFNKMITGNMYRQQATFLRDLLKNEALLSEVLGT